MECPNCDKEFLESELVYEHLGDGGQEKCPHCDYIIRKY